MPGAAVDQPFRRRESEPAGAADHDMPAVGVHWEGVDGRLRNAWLPGRRHHDLSDMAGALHQAESLTDMCAVEDAVRKRGELALGEELHDFGKQSLRQCPVGADELIDVDAEVAQIAA